MKIIHRKLIATGADYVLLQTNKNFNSGVLFTGTGGERKYLKTALRNQQDADDARE